MSSSGGNLLGLALLGKTAFAFALVVGGIFCCAWLARRLGPQRARAGQHLRVVSSTALGQRERVVIVEVQGQWLVLGVTAHQVTQLAQLPASTLFTPAPQVPTGFAERLASAVGRRLAGERKQP